MASWLPALCLILSTGTPPPDTRFLQVAPVQVQYGQVARSAGQGRAVILIEGLALNLWRPQKAATPQLRPWQLPGSLLVRTLAPDADVFAFTYSQTASVADIADLPALGENIQRLRAAGYREIVLMGFSAGGLVARQFVEDNPNAGVTRVVQVCAPNAGSSLAKLKTNVVQEAFVSSLSRRSRLRILEERREKRIPDGIEFVCVVGNGLVLGDGVVSTRSQWPEDLQAQGIPAVPLSAEHWNALSETRGVQLIARLVRENQPRWDAVQVETLRRVLFGKKG